AQLITITDYLCIANKTENRPEEKQATTTTKTNSQYSIEPDSIEYEAYTQRLTERELIAEAEKEYRDELKNQNLLTFIKNEIRRIKQNLNGGKKEKKRNKKLDSNTPAKKVLIYHPDLEIPSPDDFAIIRGIIDDDEIAPPEIIFKKGQRIEVLMKLMQAGWKYIFDKSFMGSGKSHEAGLVKPDPNDATGEDKDGVPNNKVFYFDLNHTNPSTITVEQFTNLQARHDGMIDIENKFTPSGTPHYRRAKEDEVVRIPSNCMNTKLFTALQQKGYDINAHKEEVEDDNGKKVQRNRICKNCPWVGKCHSEIGDGYGYYALRKRAFAAQRIRASIDSMPSSDDSDYSSSVAFAEEAASYLKGANEITASEQDINKFWSRIERKDPELFEILQPIRFELQDAFAGEFNEIVRGKNRGANHEILLE
ncbi:MAG TPA: hypothetical protein VIQ31_37500, partial [Phormidium sp.]